MILRTLLVLLPVFVFAAEPVKTDLFVAGEGGYETYRIPGIIVTKKGTVLVYCEARKSAKGDWGAIDIVLRRSSDGGKTFDAMRKIVEPPQVERNPVAARQNLGKQGGVTLNNPVMIADPGGAVHFLYCVEYARCFYARSDDEGATFSAPVEITPAFEALRPQYDWKVLATGPGHGIHLRNGRLIVPVWLSTGTGGHAHRPSCVSTIFSDDSGKTWRAGEIVVHTSKDIPNPSETVAVELNDGRILLNIRSEAARHRRLVSVSKDGAGGWSAPVFDEGLYEPVCFGSIVRLDEQRIAFLNPAGPDAAKNENPKISRQNLTLRISNDEGKTWRMAILLQDGIAAYSDMAVLSDGTLLAFYEAGGVNNQPYHTAALRLARGKR